MLKDKIFEIIPLGGLDGIGKNSTILRYGDEFILIDAGMMFPQDDMPGIDKIIPDFTFIKDNSQNLKGVILTHGHEDHIGALAYLLDELPLHIYGLRFTLALVKKKLNSLQTNKANFHEVRCRDKIQLGSFNIEFVHVNHSIPDSAGLIIKTDNGTIVHSGDFKIDQTPIDGRVIDLNRFAEIGDEGVLALLSDSTNSNKKGYSSSEEPVGQSFDQIFRKTKGRIIIAMFSSNIHRIQQAINISRKYNRKVVFLGRSIDANSKLAHKMDYLNFQDNDLVSLDTFKKKKLQNITIITTGSQGEPMSALSKMAQGTSTHLTICEDDTIIISAIPIPGNEKAVSRTIDNLFKLGAKVIYGSDSEIHASGHAKNEEQKLLLNLVKPKYFIPIHGDYRHLIYHSNLAESMGVPFSNIVVAQNGEIISFSKKNIKITGKIELKPVFIDGVGHIKSEQVIKERYALAEDGIFIVNLSSIKNSQKDPIINFFSMGFIEKAEQDKVYQALNKRLIKLWKISDKSDQIRFEKELRVACREVLLGLIHRWPKEIVCFINCHDS